MIEKMEISFYMEKALEEAKKTNDDSIPIGCVIVHNKTGIIISQTNNDSKLKRDPFAHAEIKAIQKTIRKLGHNYLNEYDIYITIEPCLTCFSLIRYFNFNCIIYGADNEKYGFSNFVNSQKISFPKIIKNVKSEEGIKLLQDFFKKLRDQKKELVNEN